MEFFLLSQFYSTTGNRVKPNYKREKQGTNSDQITKHGKAISTYRYSINLRCFPKENSGKILLFKAHPTEFFSTK